MQTSKPSLSVSALISVLALSACAHTTDNPALPVGEAAYDVIPSSEVEPSAYHIRPLDTLNVRVFGEPDLSSEELVVDEVGNIQMPLIGTVDAKGKSAPELSGLIAQKLGERYLVDPKVSISIAAFAPRFASVEGEVNKPGVYEIDRKATLLSAIARAESPTTTAKLSEVVVFRTVNGQRMVARFDLKDVRTGIAPDPHIIDGDVIMVGYSSMRGVVEDVLRAAPLFNAWSRF